jgi:hypothetical protein
VRGNDPTNSFKLAISDDNFDSQGDMARRHSVDIVVMALLCRVLRDIKD